ncbi:MAG: universal stress protein [Chloroflexi bacterium]|nr:universal stress protein [Chloroflexota bacterium]
MYRNALLATDGSDTARLVFQHVAQIVEPEGEIVVVEVIDDIARVFARTTPAGFELGSASYNANMAEEVVAAQRAAAEEHLAEAKADLEAAGLKNVVTAVLSGTPGEAIVDEVNARGTDVVLMGTHGRSGLRRTVLGSVADHVLRHLDEVPVLLVHANDD